MPFKLHYRDLASLAAGTALSSLRAFHKKPISELRIIDLLRDGNEPIYYGVYAFFDSDNQWLYVGKNSGSQFVERIPWHFSNEGGWMNHLLRHTKKHHNCASFCEAASIAETYSMLLVPFDDSRKRIPQLERFLRAFTEPRFNSLTARARSSYASIDLDEPLDQVLDHF